jgi:hypothetical protein
VGKNLGCSFLKCYQIKPGVNPGFIDECYNRPMSESCPLAALDILDKQGIFWDGAGGTDICVEQCVVGAFARGHQVATELYDAPEDFDTENDDKSTHYGVQWLRPNQRAGFLDVYVDDGNDTTPLEESVTAFICLDMGQEE